MLKKLQEIVSNIGKVVDPNSITKNKFLNYFFKSQNNYFFNNIFSTIYFFYLKQ